MKIEMWKVCCYHETFGTKLEYFFYTEEQAEDFYNTCDYPCGMEKLIADSQLAEYDDTESFLFEEEIIL